MGVNIIAEVKRDQSELPSVRRGKKPHTLSERHQQTCPEDSKQFSFRTPALRLDRMRPAPHLAWKPEQHGNEATWERRKMLVPGWLHVLRQKQASKQKYNFTSMRMIGRILKKCLQYFLCFGFKHAVDSSCYQCTVCLLLSNYVLLSYWQSYYLHP